MLSRTLEPPWSVDEYNDACFIVRDDNGQQLAYVYFEEEPGRNQQPSCLVRMRRDALLPTWQSYRNCCASLSHGSGKGALNRT